MNARTLGSLILFLGAAACASPAANVWNLRQVHDPDGSASYSGNLRTDLEARLMGGGELGQVGGQRLPTVADIFGIEGSLSEKDEPISDPYGVALENVVELASFDPSADEEVRALHVETFGWLAADSAFPLVRERATLELGRVGRMLEVNEPKALDADVVAVSPEELLELLRRVISAARGEGDLGPAAVALRDAPLDREGLRRALRTVTILRFGGDAGGQRMDPARSGRSDLLAKLHDHLQQEFLSQSLAAALDDPNVHVRAAAVEAAVVSSDNGLAGLLQGAILRGSEEVIVVRALDMIQKSGIPSQQGLESDEEEKDYRRSWISLCVSVLRSAYEGPIAIAAAQALERIAPEGPDTLRPEDWIRWFDAGRAWGSAPNDQ